MNIFQKQYAALVKAQQDNIRRKLDISEKITKLIGINPKKFLDLDYGSHLSTRSFDFCVMLHHGKGSKSNIPYWHVTTKTDKFKFDRNPMAVPVDFNKFFNELNTLLKTKK